MLGDFVKTLAIVMASSVAGLAFIFGMLVMACGGSLAQALPYVLGSIAVLVACGFAVFVLAGQTSAGLTEAERAQLAVPPAPPKPGQLVGTEQLWLVLLGVSLAAHAGIGAMVLLDLLGMHRYLRGDAAALNEQFIQQSIASAVLPALLLLVHRNPPFKIALDLCAGFGLSSIAFRAGKIVTGSYAIGLVSELDRSDLLTAAAAHTVSEGATVGLALLLRGPDSMGTAARIAAATAAFVAVRFSVPLIASFFG